MRESARQQGNVMARVKIEAIVEHLDSEFRAALHNTLRRHFPDAEYSISQVFRDFVRDVDRKCSTWERVPDHLVELE
jgi:hypothetical protein